MNYFFEEKSEDVIVQVRDTLDFMPHLHGQIEMGYVHTGSCDFVNDGKKYHLSAGDFHISFPNCIHSYSGSKNIHVTTIIFSPSVIPEFRTTLNTKMPNKPVFDCRNTPCKKLIQLAAEGGSAEYIRGIILAACADAFTRIDLRDFDGSDSDTLRSILIYIDAHFTAPFGINDLANDLHISRSHISHIFHNKLHTTFTKYLNSKRINHACGLLRDDGVSVTEAAFASGFETVRTFNRIFMREVGVTPREFRSKSPL